MNHRLIASSAFVITAATAFGGSVPVTATRTGQGFGQSVSGTFDGNQRGTYAGQFFFDVTVGSTTTMFTTYCIELEQRPGALNAANTYCQDLVANAPIPSGPMGALRAAAVDTLFRSAASSVNSNLLGSAFQTVLWELVYDFDGTAASINFNTGRVRFFTDFASQGAAFTTAFNTFATAATTNTSNLFFTGALTSDTLQDQVIIGRAVPLPPAAFAALPLVVAAIGVRTLRRR